MALCVAENFSIAKIIQPLYWQKHAAVSCCLHLQMTTSIVSGSPSNQVLTRLQFDPNCSVRLLTHTCSCDQITLQEIQSSTFSSSPTKPSITRNTPTLLTYYSTEILPPTFRSSWNSVPTRTKDCTNLRSFKT